MDDRSFEKQANQMQQLNTFDPNEHKPKGQIKDPHSLDPITIRPVLTKREWFAGMALQGFLSNAYLSERASQKDKFEAWAVQAADALIEQLKGGA